MNRRFEAVLVLTATMLLVISILVFGTHQGNPGWWAVAGCMMLGVIHLIHLRKEESPSFASIATFVAGILMTLMGLCALFNGQNAASVWVTLGVGVLILYATAIIAAGDESERECDKAAQRS